MAVLKAVNRLIFRGRTTRSACGRRGLLIGWANMTDRRQRRKFGRYALLGVGVLLVFHLTTLREIWRLRTVNPSETAAMQQARLLGRQARPGEWIPLEAIPNQLVAAVLAGEDAGFFLHRGVEWGAALRAVRQNTTPGRTLVGGSTITQQLAKNLFLSPERTIWRKSREAIISLELEQIVEKHRILELYLNTIEWGNGIYGCDGASRHYFGHAVDTLSRSEAAFLAAIIPAPRSCPKVDDCPSWIRRRMEEIELKMDYVPIHNFPKRRPVK